MKLCRIHPVSLYNSYTFPFQWSYKSEKNIYFRRDNLKNCIKYSLLLRKNRKIFSFGNSILFHFQCCRNRSSLSEPSKELCTLMDSRSSINRKKEAISVFNSLKKRNYYYKNISICGVESKSSTR